MTGALTPQELEILRLATWSNREIADELGLKHQAVRHLFSSIYVKLLGPGPTYRRPRCAALVKALRLGLVRLEELASGRVWVAFD